MKELFLSYTMYENYVICPLLYYWRYLKKRLSVILDHPQHRFLGIVWEDFLEAFYKGSKWRLRSEARAWSYEAVEKFFKVQEEQLMVHWKDGEREEFLREALRVADVILDTFKREALVTNEGLRIEEMLYARLGPGEKIGGRLDFNMVKDGKPWVIDFKGTKHKNRKYIHDDQLYWYATVYNAVYGKLPAYLGFWMLRFGEIHWVNPSREVINDFLVRVKGVFASIRANEFPATPSVKGCQWCMYRKQCESHDEFETNRPRKARPVLVEVSEDDGFGEGISLDV